MNKKQNMNIFKLFYSTFIIILFSLSWISNIHAMKYHDNKVHFYSSAPKLKSLIGGSFTVTDFFIRSKQDPKKHIYVGLKKVFNKGEITFSIGRKNDKSTAKWFNGKIPGSSTTFNHNAKKLNFALLGTLTLELTGGILGGGKETYTFTDIGLAQGHSFIENNWWFGGKNCKYISKDRVQCTGTNSHNSEVTFNFQRGGNFNNIEITSVNLVNTASWMKPLPDTISLNQLIMPGSHDAGMSETHHCNPIIFAEGYVLTQFNSIGSQLSNGSRYFDIRVDYDHDKLVTYHRSGAKGCNGQDLKTVLNETVTFLKTHPTETAILKFSHIRNYKDHKPYDTKGKIIDLLTRSYSNSMYKNTNATLNLANVTLGKLRGKMVIVFDYLDFIKTSSGRFRYKDGVDEDNCITKSGANITVCDDYANTDSYDKMKKDQLTKWDKFAKLDASHFFLLSWTLTNSKKNIYTMSREANKNLPNILYEQIMKSHVAKPNIVYFDFVDNKTAQSIILYNYIH